MCEMIFKPLIMGMTWSYSRIKTFYDCPYRFFLKYIHGLKENDMFYASYGSYMHKLIERYISGKITREEMKIEYILNFSTEVKGGRPSEKILQSYFRAGLNYIENFSEFSFNILEVEKKHSFKINDKNFTGVLDILGLEDNNFLIVDNKSRNLKPRSLKKSPTAYDKELDSMLTQLYLYSVPIEQEYGKLPSELCFNCFRNNTLIREKFNVYKYEDSKAWAVNSIREIENTERFSPHIDYFKCKYICGLNSECEYYSTVFTGK